MMLVFLYDIVDAGHALGALQCYVYKLVVGGVITVQTLLRSHPEASLGVDEEEGDDVAADGGGMVGLMEIVSEAIAVVLIQTELRTHPDKARLVLADVGDLVTGELVRRIEMLRLRECSDTQ